MVLQYIPLVQCAQRTKAMLALVICRRELLDIYSFAVYHRERDLMALIVEESLRDPLRLGAEPLRARVRVDSARQCSRCRT